MRIHEMASQITAVQIEIPTTVRLSAYFLLDKNGVAMDGSMEGFSLYSSFLSPPNPRLSLSVKLFFVVGGLP